MRLVTKRLILRQFLPEDEGKLAAINANAKVMEWFPAPMTAEQSAGHFARISDHWLQRGFGLFALEIRNTGQFIGFTGLSRPSYQISVPNCVEVGWRLTPDAWGNGYATEAATACLNWGFVDLGLSEIVSFTAEQNARSIAVMRRLGMTHDKANDFDHPMLEADSPLLRHVLYRRKSQHDKL